MHSPRSENTCLSSVLGNGDGAGQFGSSAAVDDLVVADEVANDAEGVVETALGLLHDHLVPAAYEDGHGLRVRALLDDEHALVDGAEGELADEPGAAQLLRRQLFEAGHDAPVGRYGDQLKNSEQTSVYIIF